MSNINIEVTVRGRTSLALLVATNDGASWIPFSQIVEKTEEPGLGGPEIKSIVIPDWLARMKGLLRDAKDERTDDMFGGA